MSEFFSRVVINDPDTGDTLIFTQGLEQPGVNGNTLSFIIDIDIFKEHAFNVDSDDYWQLLDWPS